MKRRYYRWLSRHENIHSLFFYLRLAPTIITYEMCFRMPHNGWEGYMEHSLTHDEEGL